MDNRQYERVNCTSSFMGTDEILKIFLCDYEHIICHIHDISVGGVCIEFECTSEEYGKIFKQDKSHFCKIDYASDYLIVNSRIMWNKLITEANNMLVKCGLSFDIITPADRLFLSSLVLKIRKIRSIPDVNGRNEQGDSN